MGLRRRRLIAEMMHVSHHVVPEAPLVLRRRRQVGVVEVRPHRGERRVGDVEPELALALRQRQPHPPPQPDAVTLAPQPLHRGRGVAGAEGGAVAVVGHRNSRSV